MTTAQTPAPRHPQHNKDITGRRFGRLVALHPTDRRSKKQSVIWQCRCDCGSTVLVPQNGLVYGHYRSCGCLQAEQHSRISQQLHRVDGTCLEWLEKRKHRSDCTTGFRGVTLLKNGRYRVSIGFKGRRYHVGVYPTYEEAVAARLNVEHEIHDGFAAAYRAWDAKAQADPGWGEAHPLVYEVEKRSGVLTVLTNRDELGL